MTKTRKEDVIASARIYAAANEEAVLVYEVVVPPEARELYAADPGAEPKFATLVERTAVTMLPRLRELVPDGTQFVQVYRATPPQWN
jgi:hypothetical protein